MTLLGAAQIRELAALLDLKPSKSLGQNFVIDSNVCSKIVRTAGVTPDDIALENLDSLFATLHNTHMNLEFISGPEHWNVRADVL